MTTEGRDWWARLMEHYKEDPNCTGCDLHLNPTDKAIRKSMVDKALGPKTEGTAKMIDVSAMDSIDYMLVINELGDKIHENARTKGFYDQAVSFPQAIALIHSEVSEALEAHRNAQPVSDIEEELADIIIRVLDTARYHGFNIGSAILTKMEKNSRREKKHGKRY